MLLNRTWLMALAAGVTLSLVFTASAQARVSRLEARSASLSKTASDCATPEPACCTPEPACCPDPCIHYRHRGPKLCCGCCKPPQSIVLKVADPCTGCETDVPVCLPACCEGEPTVCCGRGFLGRDVVVYEWCCGYSVRVAFKRCGDLLVTTWGR